MCLFVADYSLVALAIQIGHSEQLKHCLMCLFVADNIDPLEGTHLDQGQNWALC
jgi:hypothetical protein